MTQDVSPSAFIVRNTVSGVTPSFSAAAKSLAKRHQDMGTYSSTSDVKSKESICADASCAGFAPDVLPEVLVLATEDSHTGVSTENALFAKLP